MSEQINNIKERCLEKWCGQGQKLDERLQSFNEGFENWIRQIPIENQPTVITLIENLEYYSHRTTNLWLRTLHTKLLENDGISDENTIYAFIKSGDGKTNSSNDYWTEYKAINKLNKHICIENMDALDPEDWEYIENIVFIDDFSGSGKSFIKELKKSPERYRDKNIYFITINTMIHAAEKITRYCEENGMRIILLSAFNQVKAFERDLFDDNIKAKAEIKKMSEGLDIPGNDILGFEKTQALVAFYNNTPNNTLGFIRYSTEKYKSIFPRKDDSVPHWKEMRKKRRDRDKANYNNKITGDKG